MDRAVESRLSLRQLAPALGATLFLVALAVLQRAAGGYMRVFR
jgi:hypothetical protein